LSTKVAKLVSDLIYQGRWDEAHSVLARFATQESQDSDSLCQLGALALSIGKFDECQRYIRAALTVNPENSEAYYQLGLCMLKQERASEAMSAFRDACERRPQFAVGHLHWGLALFQMGNFRGAIGQFRQAAKLAPNLAAALYQSGVANARLGQYKEAMQDFQQATQIDPNFAEAYNAMGICLTHTGDFAGAVNFYARACELDNSLAIAHANCATAQINLGQVNDALVHYREALAPGAKPLTAKERAFVYNNWGVSLYLAKEIEQAAEKIMEACNIDPTFNESQINLGLVRTALHEYEMATVAFEQAISNNMNVVEVYMYCGIAYLLGGKYKEALDRLGHAQSRGLKGEQLDMWMAFAQLALGRTETAQLHFDRVAQQNPNNFLALDGLGSCMALLGAHQKAIQAFDRSLQINPNFGLGHLHRGRSYEALGQTISADTDFKQALTIDPNCLLPEKEMIDELLKGSEFVKALQRSIKILEIDSKDDDARLALASALKSQNRLVEALGLVQTIVAKETNNGPAYTLCGQIYMLQGNYVEADDMFRRASTLINDDAGLYFSWGRTLSILGFHELALEKYQKASEIDPFDGDIYDSWGNALKTLGRFNEAGEVFKKASKYL
jgi:tetratricopeptide (TPR) repeat protein